MNPIDKLIVQLDQALRTLVPGSVQSSRANPADAAPEILAVTDPYKKGAELLVGRAKAVHLESGYTEEAFDALVTQTEADIAAELSSTDPATAPPYSFEDCAALIGL